MSALEQITITLTRLGTLPIYSVPPKKVPQLLVVRILIFVSLHPPANQHQHLYLGNSHSGRQNMNGPLKNHTAFHIVLRDYKNLL
jgi:chorismate mutase